MACEKPNYFLDLGKKENGKRNLRMINMKVDYNLRMLQERYGDKNILVVPCGKCPSCIKAYRRSWSMRCEAEARLHKDNCYITLTLENQYLKEEPKKTDLQKFFKDLRNKGYKFRYFACGEYGEKKGRPHYHAILFGFCPDDLKYFGKSKTGFDMFTSKLLEGIWKKGIVRVQLFSPECAGYVAGYVDKKEDKTDGFLMMSTRPGLGYDYYRQHMSKLIEVDNFQSKNGFVAPLPRYFEKAADDDWQDISDLKSKRIEKAKTISIGTAQQHGFSNLEEVYKYQGDKERRKKKYARSL